MRDLCRVFFVLAIIIALIGCKDSSDKALNKPVVSVNDELLTFRQLYDAIPNGLSKDDSLIFANDYLKRWVRGKLLLQRAELNLTPAEKDVDALLEEYRASLLVYKYQQKIVEQKYKSDVADSEIDDYYRDHSSDFQLWDPIVKGGFIIVSRNAPNVESIESQIKRFKSSDITSLEGYCFQNAKKYLFFPDEWKSLPQLLDELDINIADVDQFLQKEKFYKSTNLDNYTYFVVSDYQPSGSLAPIEFVRDRIRSIIVNKKRMSFIKEMESELYDDGVINGTVKFFK